MNGDAVTGTMEVTIILMLIGLILITFGVVFVFAKKKIRETLNEPNTLDREETQSPYVELQDVYSNETKLENQKSGRKSEIEMQSKLSF